MVIHLPDFGSQCEELRENYKIQSEVLETPVILMPKYRPHLFRKNAKKGGPDKLLWGAIFGNRHLVGLKRHTVNGTNQNLLAVSGLFSAAFRLLLEILGGPS